MRRRTRMISSVAVKTTTIIELTSCSDELAMIVKTLTGNKLVPGGYTIMLAPNSQRQKRKQIQKALKTPSDTRGS